MTESEYRELDMRALTIKPKWAHLVMSGEKRIENRSWPTSLRGSICIRAGSPEMVILGQIQVVDYCCPQYP